MKRLLVVTLLCAAAFGGEKHAPLPEKILKAKTVFLDNQSGSQDAVDGAYTELSRQHRLSITESRRDADLIFIFSTKEVPAASVTHGTIAPNGDIDATTSPSATRRATLSVIDPRTGEALWSDTKSFGSMKWAFVPGGVFVPHNAFRDLVKEFARRVRER